MKILAIVLGYPPKRFIGSEMYDHALFKKLIAEGNTVDVVATSQTEESYVFEGVNVNPELGNDYTHIVVHVDARQKGYYYQRLLGLNNVPLIGVLHNSEQYTMLEATFYWWDSIIVNSQSLAEFGGFKLKNDLLCLIPPSPEPLKRLGIKGNRKYLVTQINGAPIKGGIDVLEALAKENSQHKMRIVEGGYGVTPQPKHTNIDFVKQAVLDKDFWAETETLILPSKSESWGMVASEAIANNVGVVTFDDLIGVKENLGSAGEYVSRSASIKDWSDAVNRAFKKTGLLKQAKVNFKAHNDQLDKAVVWFENIGKTYL